MAHLPPLPTSDAASVPVTPAPCKATTEEEEDDDEDGTLPPLSTKRSSALNTMPVSSSTAGVGAYTWRIDLSKTEQYWRGWFSDMSKLFLSVPEPKLLLVAGVDRLDKELTIAQMQGEFSVLVAPLTLCQIFMLLLPPERYFTASRGFMRYRLVKNLAYDQVCL